MSLTEPLLEIPAELPIAAEADRITELIRANQVVIVAGATGSGKTTQLPKLCLLAGRERIAHTQPRRIAARSVAQRIAAECGTELGDFVGYQVRFTRQTSADTRIKVMTDGILLNELTYDRDLRRYDTIIIDEAHERSLNIDFLLGYLKQLISRRPELRVIVTSATIDTERFSRHFDDAPIVEVSGRTYPVEIRYRPLTAEQDQVDGICAAVTELMTETTAGDILVFLSGEREIRDAAEAVAGLELRGVEIVPLYARLSAADQQRVFQSHRLRRVVLATNVAETSITVPGIGYVIDTGTARISRYSARTKVQRLPIEEISQASANQRSGRCGRLGPGIAIRLYDESDYLARPEFTEPEILRTNLATVILQMVQAGLGDIASFPFVEAPIASQIGDGLRVLQELGALRPRQTNQPLRLTKTGRVLAQLPVDPKLGRMLVEASRRGCLFQVQVLVAGLSLPDVRERPVEHQQAADELHRRFNSPVTAAPDQPTGGQPKRHTVHTGTRKQSSTRSQLEGGDFEAMLNLWQYLRDQRHKLSGNAFRKMCRAEYLHYLRFREWGDLISQLKDACEQANLAKPTSGAMPDVLRSLLSGLLGNIGLRIPDPAPEKTRSKTKRRPLTEYQGARGVKFAIQPGSALVKAKPELVMAFELVETSRLWARTVAEIQPEWVEQVAGELVTRTLSEPSFSPRSATVVASERVTLFGVPVVAGRRRNYANSHPEDARQIFIRSGIVEGQWETRQQIIASNRFAYTEAEQLTDRMRRPELLVSDDQLFEFYDKTLPPEVCSGATFELWAKQLETADQPLLTPADLVLEPSQLKLDQFPDHWQVGDLELPIRYVFDPGSGQDGVTIEVPLATLPTLETTEFSWQVPGLRAELVTELIRGLPKAIRTNFVPAPDWANRALEYLADNPSEESLPAGLSRALLALTGEQVPVESWRPDQVASHLVPTFVVRDGDKEVGRGTDLIQLKTKLASAARTAFADQLPDLVQTGQRSWSFGTIPQQVAVAQAGHAWPCLQDEGDSVGLSLADTPEGAARNQAAGLRRLLTLVNPSPVRWVVAHLSSSQKLALGASPYPSVPELLADAWLKASDTLLRSEIDPVEVRDQATWDRIANLVRAETAPATARIVATAADVLARQAEIQTKLFGLPAEHPVRQDVAEQLANLVFNRFISATPDPWFNRLPIYLEGASRRIAGVAKNPTGDQRKAEQVWEIEAEYGELCDQQPPGPLPPAVEEVAFLIEELRLSLFAQPIATAVPVSVKRIRSAMAAAS